MLAGRHAGDQQKHAGDAVSQPDVGGERHAGPQAPSDEQIGRKAPAANQGKQVAQQRLTAGRGVLTVAPEDAQATGQRQRDARQHIAGWPFAE